MNEVITGDPIGGSGASGGAGGAGAIAGDPSAKGAANPALDGTGDDKPITRAELKSLLAEHAKGQSAQTTADVAKASKAQLARQHYIMQEMKEFPQTYWEKMPVTDDPKALRQAHDELRAQINADFQSHIDKHPRSKEVWAILRPNVGGAARDGGQVGHIAQDVSKLSPEQKIAVGLKPHIAPDARAAV